MNAQDEMIQAKADQAISKAAATVSADAAKDAATATASALKVNATEKCTTVKEKVSDPKFYSGT